MEQKELLDYSRKCKGLKIINDLIINEIVEDIKISNHLIGLEIFNNTLYVYSNEDFTNTNHYVANVKTRYARRIGTDEYLIRATITLVNGEEVNYNVPLNETINKWENDIPRYEGFRRKFFRKNLADYFHNSVEFRFTLMNSIEKCLQEKVPEEIWRGYEYV